MHRWMAVPVALVLLLTVFAGSTWGAGEPTLEIVGYQQGGQQAAQLAIQAAGGQIVRSSPELGFTVARTNDPTNFERTLRLNPTIDYVERDDPTRIHGAQWNGAQWNGAQWNGAQWNGAQWNGGQWNGGQWNGGQWNGAQWNAFQFTVQNHQAELAQYRYDVTKSDPGLVWQWGLWATKAPKAWETNIGSNRAKLCVLDSGVAYDHPDIAPNLWTGPLGEHGINVIDPSAPASDDAGHGTHIAGIAAGRVHNAFGVAGVANVQIMSAKVLDASGNGLEDQLAIGIAWCAMQGAKVAVMALSVTEPGPSLDRAIKFATDRDVLLLASAGNVGPCTNCVAYPASDPRVLAVTAVGGSNTVATFAASGPEVALAAPGVDILGPFPGNAFVFGSGTSQAVAMAAGVASLVRDAAPGLSAAQTSQVLLSTTKDLGTPGPDATFGAGLVDAQAALARALAP